MNWQIWVMIYLGIGIAAAARVGREGAGVFEDTLAMFFNWFK